MSLIAHFTSRRREREREEQEAREAEEAADKEWADVREAEKDLEAVQNAATCDTCTGNRMVILTCTPWGCLCLFNDRQLLAATRRQ
eukprot:SAG31_NODE_1146_length_9677_cov_8.375131_4_plen_86_part_00